MATQWFCELMGKVVGPLTAAELLTKVRKGEIADNTPIRKNDSRWYPAVEVNGLFEAAFRDDPERTGHFIETEYLGDT